MFLAIFDSQTLLDLLSILSSLSLIDDFLYLFASIRDNNIMMINLKFCINSIRSWIKNGQKIKTVKRQKNSKNNILVDFMEELVDKFKLITLFKLYKNNHKFKYLIGHISFLVSPFVHNLYFTWTN